MYAFSQISPKIDPSQKQRKIVLKHGAGMPFSGTPVFVEREKKGKHLFPKSNYRVLRTKYKYTPLHIFINNGAGFLFMYLILINV